MENPDVLVRIVNAMNCSADEALMIYGYIFIITVALLGFSINFFFDAGVFLCELLKRMLSLIRRRS